MKTIEPTDYQSKALAFRKRTNLALLGGRGSGKSMALMLHVVDHCRTLGPDARPLVVREQWNSLTQLQDEIYEMCVAAFGARTTRNKNAGMILLPTGGIIYFTNIGDEASYRSRQGLSFTGLYGDEIGAWPPQCYRLFQRFRSNLRAPHMFFLPVVISANPHGGSHSLICRDYVNISPPWTPFYDKAGDIWIWTDSDYTMNPHIDTEKYKRQLVAAAGHDPALLDAWLKGTWGTLGGVMFEQFDPAVHILPADVCPNYDQARWLIGADRGSSAPATGIMLCQVKDNWGPLRYGSIVCLDERDTCLDAETLNKGTGMSPAAFGQVLDDMWKETTGSRMRPKVVSDDTRGLHSSADTVCQIYRDIGLEARPPEKKDRIGNWNLIRMLLSAAVTGDGPGLYFRPQCKNLLTTLPEAPRGTLNAEDVDPKWDCDHHVDGLAYGVRQLWINTRRRTGNGGGYYYW